MIVVADTSPINYLTQLGLASLLQRLYSRVILPHAVLLELRNPGSPAVVRNWALNLPEWIEVRSPDIATPEGLAGLGPGEREALTLAIQMKADVVLVDEQKARHVARTTYHLPLSGTVGVLRDAHRYGWLDGAAVFDALCLTTNFRHTARVRQAFLDSLTR